VITISKKYPRKRSKIEHEKVDSSDNVCINCFDIGTHLLDGYSLDISTEGKPDEKFLAKMYYCFNCGHVWESHEDGDIYELGSEFKEYVWKKVGRKPPETKI